MLDARIAEVITQIPSLLDTAEPLFFTEPHSPLGIQQAVKSRGDGDGEVFSESQGVPVPLTHGDMETQPSLNEYPEETFLPVYRIKVISLSGQERKLLA